MLPRTLPLLLPLLLLALNWGGARSQGIGVPAELLAKALNHAAGPARGGGGDLVGRLREGDVAALYEAAMGMQQDGGGDRISAVLLLHQLADSSAHHIPSMVALGFAYSEEDPDQAVRYFVQAGEDGPHQAALYNAGRLLAEQGDGGGALAYIRASANLTGRSASPEMTATAAGAYAALSDRLLGGIGHLTLQQMANAFPYASLDGVPREGGREDRMWRSAMGGLEAHARGEGGGGDGLEEAREALIGLREFEELSELQRGLLGGILSRIGEILDGRRGEEL